MADFNQAFLYLEPNEGNYVNDPRDTGGETYKGVSRKNWPNWDGWSYVDKAKLSESFPANLSNIDDLQNAVKQFYRKQFWHFDGVTNQDLANKIFDECVNLGSASLIRLLQTSIRYISKKNITVDGQYGPQTEVLINIVDAGLLLGELRAQIAVYYCKLNRPEYLLGWMRRATR